MVIETQIEARQSIFQEYRDYTDKYFLRTKAILEAEGINPLVRYQIFARKGGEVKGVDAAVEFVKEIADNKVKVYALKDRQSYNPREPLMKLEGRIQDLVDLETGYLGITSGGLTGKIELNEVRQKAKDIIIAAEGKPVYYFGARHFHYTLDEEISRICKDEGFAGCSTDIGAKAWNSKGIGTIPHALIIAYAAHMRENGIEGNPTVEAAKGFDKNIDPNAPRIVLIDTFNREADDALETARVLPSLKGVRIDTCGENYAQGSRELIISQHSTLPRLDVPDIYIMGKGVTIPAQWALRQALVKNGFARLESTVSSGFNAEKTKAFLEADKAFQKKYGFPLFTNIGTGSIANPVMTTSDIVAYFSEKRRAWIPIHKVGRPEVKTNRLKEV